MSKAKRYRNHGPLPVAGIAPGATGSAVLTDEQEARHLASGRLSVQRGRSGAERKANPDADAPDPTEPDLGSEQAATQEDD